MSTKTPETFKGPSSASFLLFASVASSVAFAAPAPVAAQDQGQPLAMVEEITITARRREESLQRTPISVSAFSEAALEKRSIQNLADVSQYVPNVTIAVDAVAGGMASQIFIRGIGQNDYRVFADGGVGLYVDGVFIARNIGGLMDVLDLERIEVLRGPQGTLYGKNTIGGAISFVSRKPHEALEGKVEGTYGRFDRMDVKGDVNVPITDRFFMKLTAASLNRDGYGRRLLDAPLAGDGFSENDRDTSNVDTTLGRAQFRYKGEDVDVHLVLDRSKIDSNGTATHLEAVNSTGALVGLYNAIIGNPTGNSMDERFIARRAYDDYGQGDSTAQTDIWGVALTVDVNLGGADLKSITAYREMDNTIAIDVDRLPVFILEQTEFNKQDQISQELQLSGSTDRFKWVGGLYFFQEKSSRFVLGTVVPDLFDLGLFGVGPDGFPIEPGVANDLDFKSTSYAAYGQATYNLTDRFSTTLGLRYTYEKKEIHGRLFTHFTRRFLGTADNEENWDSISPRVGLEYQWTDDLMTFVSASHGFKSGGFNGRFDLRVPNGGAVAYNPEKVWTYEAGFRSDLMDRRLRLNGTAFLNKYDDIQFQNAELIDGQVVVLTGNVAKATMYGFEAELVATPMANLTLNGAFGYTHAEYDDVGTAVGLTLDSAFVITPKWSLTAGADYVWDLGDAGSLTFRGDISYRSRLAFDINPTQYSSQKGYALANTRITYTEPNDAWQIAVFVTNLTDKRYRMNAADSLDDVGFAFAQYGPPRQWGVTGTFRF